MKKEIEKYITNLESESGIKVLLAVESGSRSWRFPSTDSDYDVRMIYVHKPEWYYSLSNQKDTIEYMSADRVFDLSGWELRKALMLMSKTNPSLTDWLFSDIIYKSDNEFLEDIRMANDAFYNPMHAAHHYASMARHFTDILNDAQNCSFKKYLYFLRAILNVDFILSFEKHPPVRFQELLGMTDIPTDINRNLIDLIDAKATIGEKAVQRIDANLMDFARNKYTLILNKLQTFKPNWTYPSSGLKDLDDLAIKHISKP